MKTFIMLVVFTVIICFFAGCGPGQPFEIEERHISQSEVQMQVVAVK